MIRLIKIDVQAIQKLTELEPTTRANQDEKATAVKHMGYLRFLPQSGENPDVTADNVLTQIHDDLRSYYISTATDSGAADEEIRFFEKDWWPVLKKALRTNPAMVELMLKEGVKSRYLMTFIVDIARGNLALAVLAGNYIVHTVEDGFAIVPVEDPAYSYCTTEGSLSFVRFRTKEIQETFRDAKNVICLGAGLEPSVFMYGYQPPEDQTFVMYDLRDHSQYWEKILGVSTAEYGIEYHTEPLANALSDPNRAGMYDVVCLSGVASYSSSPMQLTQMFLGVNRLLRPGGTVVFDLQTKHESYLFDVKVMGWPVSMTLEENVASAVEKVSGVLQASRLVFDGYKTEHDSERLRPAESQVDTSPVGGVVFWAHKSSDTGSKSHDCGSYAHMDFNQSTAESGITPNANA